MNDDKRVEASIPVQGRVDIRRLAEMLLYFEGSGVNVKSMSMLVSWSVDVVCRILGDNGLLPKLVETIEEAHQHLELRDLYQPGMKKRGKKKIEAAMRFENLRFEGIEPSDIVPREYNTLHNKNSVKAFSSEEVERVRVEGEEKYQRYLKEKNEEGMKKIKEKRKNNPDTSTIHGPIDHAVRLKEIAEEDKELANMDLSAPKDN